MSNKMKWAGAGILVFIVCFFVLSGPVLAQDKIKVGVMFSMTGAGSAIGKIQLDGVKLAIKQLNDAGGLSIGGKKLRVEAVIRDDESKPDVAVRRFRELVQDEKVNAFVGCTFAHIAKALNEQAAQIKDFLFFPVCSPPESVFSKGEKAPYTLNNLGANEGIGRISADYVAKKFKPKHVVLFLPDYAFGRGAGAGANKVFKTRYPNIKVSEVWSPLGSPDFTSYINKIEELKPDVVMLGHWGNDGIGVLKQIYEMKLAKKTKIFYNWVITGFKDPAVVKAAQKLSDAWRKEYNEPPDPYAMNAYAGMIEVARGWEIAKSVDPAKVYKAIMDNPKFEGPKGPATWRVDGRPHYKYTSFIVEGKGPKDRKDPKWDFAKVIDTYEGDDYEVDAKELGW
jgi:branched-chain amino acid transport system substrate-binding protein